MYQILNNQHKKKGCNTRGAPVFPQLPQSCTAFPGRPKLLSLPQFYLLDIMCIAERDWENLTVYILLLLKYEVLQSDISI